MLLFNPMTGLTHLGLFHNPGDHSHPPLDLLQTQRASLYYSCDCGVHSSHEVLVSVCLGEADAPTPREESGTLVTCPACHQHGFLESLQVVHDPAEEKVTLWLPEADRSRALGVLSAWFFTLQASGREVIPPYALQPHLAFLEPPERMDLPSTAEELVTVNRNVKRRLLEQTQTSRKNDTPPLPHSLLDKEGDFLRSEDSPEESPSQEQKKGPGTTQSLKSPPSAGSLPAAASVPPSTFTESYEQLDQTSDHRPSSPTGTENVFPFSGSSSRSALSSSEIEFTSTPTSILGATSSLTPPSVKPTLREGPPPGPYTTGDFAPPILTPPELVVEEHEQAFESGSLEPPRESLESLPVEEVELATLLAPASPADEEAPSEEEASQESPQELSSMSNEELLPEDGFEKPQTQLSSFEVVLEESEHSLEEEKGNETDSDLQNLTLPLVESISEDLSAVLERETASSEESERDNELLEMEDENPRFEIFSSGEVVQEPGEATLINPSPKRPSSPPPEEASEGHIAEERALGEGVTLHPAFTEPRSLQRFARSWKKQDTAFSFGFDPKTNTSVINLLVAPETFEALYAGGSVQCLLQLHRMSTYPLLTFLGLFEDREGESLEQVISCFDIDDPKVLMFLDMLMQRFSLRVQFCLDRESCLGAATLSLPLEQNIEYYLSEARAWKEQLENVDFKQACDELVEPEYDLVGRLNHNFQQDTFLGLNLPSQTRLALGIMGYWSEPAKQMYLVERKSFPISTFQKIQGRVLDAAISMGLQLPEHLLNLALEWELASSAQELYTRMIHNFGELNLQIQFTNDLDPWDNLENWHHLFEVAEKIDIEINENIEEIAEIAQRRCHDEQEIMVESVEDFEIVEDFYDMGNTDLLDLLVEPEYRLESALALAEKLDAEMLPRIASVYPDLAYEELEPYMEALLKFGNVIEMYLLQWGELSSKLHKSLALKTLGKLKSEQGLPLLVQSLHLRDAWEAASEGLFLMGPATLPLLAAELQNPNWIVRLRAVKTIARIGGEESLSLLGIAKQDSNEMVRNEAEAQLQSPTH